MATAAADAGPVQSVPVSSIWCPAIAVCTGSLLMVYMLVQGLGAAAAFAGGCSILGRWDHHISVLSVRGVCLQVRCADIQPFWLAQACN